MNLVFQTLSKSLHPPKPYLFYGPSFSGKKTAIKGAFESLYIRPIVLTMDEAKHAPLNPIDFRGKLGYIVYLDEKLDLLPKDSQLIVVYVTLDPYSLGTTEQLNAKFTLVDLSRFLTPRGTVDRELVRCPPWELFPQLASRNSNYDSKLVSIERNPMFTQTLHNNLFGITLDKGKERIILPSLEVEVIADTLEHLSMLDRSFYVEHSGEHANLLENLAIIRGLRLNGGERLDWTKKHGHNRFNTVNVKDRKRTEAALSRFSTPASGEVLKLGTNTAPKKPSKRPADSGATDTPAKPRKAPQCKQCKVPLKGHKCPNKKPKS
jgi:hypothetical protein